MTIKILSGEASGTKLFSPDSEKLRPTSVLLRRRLFDSNQDLLEQSFVDACCGTGLMGLEAWSRGAKKIFFVDNSRLSHQYLAKNIEQVKKGRSRDIDFELIKKSLLVWQSEFKTIYLTSGILQEWIFFFDPPYEQIKFYNEMIEFFFNKEAWYQGRIWIESDEKKGIPLDRLYKLVPDCLSRVFRQGSRYILALDLRD